MIARWQWVIAVLALLALLLIAFANRVGAQQKPEAPILYENIRLDPALLHIDKRALEEAYHDQLLHLFEVWLRGGELDDAKRFRTGLQNARRAYDLASQAIAKREQQLIELDKQNQEQKR